MGKSFAIMDTGSKSVTALAVTWTRGGEYILEAFCRMSSRGIDRGTITDLGLATDCISDVLTELKKKAKRDIHDVYAGVSSPSVKLTKTAGTILLSKHGKEISERDVKKCIEVAAEIKNPINKEALHKLVRTFTLDGEAGIRDPLNLEGVKLEADVNVLTINSSVLWNISKCIANAGFVPAGFVFSGLASSHRVLNEEDRYKGVLLMNLRKSLTETMIFDKGSLDDCRVYPVGTDDFLFEENNVIEGALAKLSKSIMSISEWGKVRKIVAVGEGALDECLITKLEDIFAVPVKPGRCIVRPFEDLPADKGGYVTGLGILDHLLDEKKTNNNMGSIFRETAHRITSFIDKYF